MYGFTLCTCIYLSAGGKREIALSGKYLLPFRPDRGKATLTHLNLGSCLLENTGFI